MSPSALEKVRDRQAKSRERNRGTIVKVVIYGVPLVALVLGFFGYRHYAALSTIEEVRQIVAQARAYNATTESSIEAIVTSEADALPPDLTSRLEYSAKLAKVLGSVLHGEGRPQGKKGGAKATPMFMPMMPAAGLPPAVSGSTAQSDEPSPEPAAAPLTPRGRAIRDAVALTELISRQCTLIEDRLNVCEASGDLVMLPGTDGLIERYRRLGD